MAQQGLFTFFKPEVKAFGHVTRVSYDLQVAPHVPWINCIIGYSWAGYTQDEIERTCLDFVVKSKQKYDLLEEFKERCKADPQCS